MAHLTGCGLADVYSTLCVGLAYLEWVWQNIDGCGLRGSGILCMCVAYLVGTAYVIWPCYTMNGWDITHVSASNIKWAWHTLCGCGTL